MGYCWDPWAIIPNDPWYTISCPWYFIRRNLKNPSGFSCYLFEIFFALKFWPRHFRSFYFLTNPFSEYFDLDRAIRFRSGFVLVRVQFQPSSTMIMTVHHRDRLPSWSWSSNTRPYHLPSIIVTMTLFISYLDSLTCLHGWFLLL